VIHTSDREYGQVYVPIDQLAPDGRRRLCWSRFQTSAKLAFAYGMAVTGTIVIDHDPLLRHRPAPLARPLWCALGRGVLPLIELAFFAANLTKFSHGAWLPLRSAGPLLRHDHLVPRAPAGHRPSASGRGPAAGLRRRARTARSAGRRVPGTGVFMNRGKETAPLSMRACVDHLHSLPENAMILSLETLPSPGSAEDRLEVDDLGYTDDRITFVRAKHGYAEEYDVPKLVRQIAKAGVECPVDPRNASFYLSRVELEPSHKPGMSYWRKRVFLLICADPRRARPDYFKLPRERTITLGSEIEF
jgi:KUP system potassium uptake protein